MFQTRVFWGVFAVCTAIVFLAAINLNRTYQSETKIIFLPKNASMGNNMEAVLFNAKQIASSVSFYTQMIEENPEIEDPVDQLPADKRKEYWDDTLTVERLDKSHVLRVQAVHKDREQAELLVSRATRDIATVMSKYYDIRNDLEVRIIETALTRSVSMAYAWEWFLGSLAAGFILAAGIFQSTDRAERGRVRTEKKSPPPYRGTQPWYPLMEKIKTEVKDPPKEIVQPKVGKIEKKETPSPGKKSSAPENLPVGNELVLKKEAPEDEKKMEGIRDHEATPEEVKKRLNKLLKGEM